MLSKGPSKYLANSDLANAQLQARTDGRTNGRTTHLEEISFVPERAGEKRCPDAHPNKDRAPVVRRRIRPAGMTLARAVEIANGAEPRLRRVS